MPIDEGPASRPSPNGQGASPAASAPDEGIAAPASSRGASRAGSDWLRHLDVLRRRKWLLLLVAITGTGTGVLAAATVDAEYLAEIRLWVDAPEGGSDQGPLRTEALLQSYDWVDLLTSYAVLEDVVFDRRLYLRPRSARDTAALAGLSADRRFVPGRYELRLDEEGSVYELWRGDTVLVEAGRPGEPVGAGAGMQWRPPRDLLPRGRRVRFELVHPRDAARELGERLDVRMLERGRFLHVTLTGTDPAGVAATLNAIGDRFIELSSQLQRSQAEELEARLAEQLATAAADLRRAEAELELFRSGTATLPSGGGAASLTLSELGPTHRDYFQLLYERDRIRRDRRAVEAVLDDRDDAAASAGLIEAVAVATGSTQLSDALAELSRKRIEVRALSQEYTAEHPDVIHLTDEIRTLERITVPGMVQGLAAALAAREAQLSREIATRGTQLVEIPQRATEEARLVRTAAIAGELYTGLKERHETARLAAASAVPRTRVLDRAEPARRPVTDIRVRLVLLFFTGSMGLGLVGTLLHDRIDPRIRYPEEVSRDMGLTILGSVPHLPMNGGRTPESEAESAEVFRGIRLNLSYAYGAAGPLAVTVTSTGPSDGKSFVTANLARGFARMGRRTLLVDGDVRRGRLHHEVGVSRRPGLIDHLAGEATLEEIVRETGEEGLYLIPSGMRRQDAPELLAAAHLGELVAELRHRYDAVLIDTPPLGVGVDPILFSALTGNLLLVIRSGATPRGLTQTKLEHVSRLPVRVLGAVLNDVPASRSYPYYYSYFPRYAPEEERGTEN